MSITLLRARPGTLAASVMARARWKHSERRPDLIMVLQSLSVRSLVQAVDACAQMAWAAWVIYRHCKPSEA
jgi:hypothetical protein